MVTVGNMQGVATAYQGSGLENGTGQKVFSDAAATQKAADIPLPAGSGAAKASGQEGAPLEVTEPNRSDSVKRAVEQINQKANNSEAIFGIHEDTNRVTIKIVDKKTKEVIKEFPPEETLDMIAKVWELAGLMVDEKR